MPRVKADDTVVMPSGRRALVIHRDSDGFCTCRYLDLGSKEPLEALLVTLPEYLLRVCQPGREVPKPVRINGSAG